MLIPTNLGMTTVQPQLRTGDNFVPETMARKAAPAPEEAAEEPKKPVGSYTNRSLAAAQVEKTALRKLLQDAVTWCRENGKGARKALKTGLFPGVTRNLLDKALRKSDTVVHRDHHNQILTNQERMKLATWLIECADGQKPKDRDQIASKIRTLLRERHRFNRSRKYGVGCIPLSRVEVEFVNKTTGIYQTFFANLFAWFKGSRRFMFVCYAIRNQYST